MSDPKNRLLTIDDLAERWGVSVDMAMSVTARRGVPHLNIGGRSRPGRKSIRFRLDAVEAWEKSQETVQASPDVDDAEAFKAKARRMTDEQLLYAAGWDGVDR